jgi:signal transduction histidine kinase
MLYIPGIAWKKALSRPSLTLAGACVTLVIYIGFLMMSNYQNQVALRESALKRFRLDLEKRGASLGYFFSERKYDLRALGVSREILTYFTNKSLGMSEQYGLKVNLFIIRQMLSKTLTDKLIQGIAIYERFILADPAGRLLADTAEQGDAVPPSLWQNYLTHPAADPILISRETDAGFQILLIGPAPYRNQLAGVLIAWLSIQTLSEHFVDFSEQSSAKGFDLAREDGRLICIHEQSICPIARAVTSERLADIPDSGFLSFFDDEGGKDIFITRIPVHNSPLNLVAWVRQEELFGSLTPWQLLAGTGSLAFVILLGTGFLIRINTNHMVLRAQFEASEQQQALLDKQVRERSHELVLANEDLKKEIEHRTKAETDLEKAYNELKETQAQLVQTAKLASIGELAAGVAHELNQPLMVIRTTAQILIRSLQKLPPERVEEHLKTVERNTFRMMNIINHLRAFSRQSSAMLIDVDINRLLEEAFLMVGEQLRLRDIGVEKNLAPELPLCCGNPNQLEQVFLNLITNARDAITEKIEKTGSQTKCKGRLDITTRISSEYPKHIEILFKDNGYGIPPELVEKIFDPFFTTKEVGKGTGLGLSISYGIIKDHKGGITVEETSSEGTTFKICLPGAVEADNNY